jgi:membrane-associated phospholipid phosphatase
MKKETYENIMDKLRKDDLSSYIGAFTSIFVFVIALIYIILFVMQFLLSENGFGFYLKDLNILKINYVLVPMLGFTAVSIYRKKVNSPRPYEVYEFTPLYKKYMNPAKRKQGQSFPSRHVYSAFAIGMAVLSVYSWLGIVVLIMGAWMALFRVIMGVHFPRDVIAGALIGTALGLVGNIIMPIILK